MLRPTFTLRAQHAIVIYARMSDPSPNLRSPDQQITVIKRLHLPWRIVKIYRDNGKSALYKYNRPEFNAMLDDLKAGQLQVDPIAVDTFERLSRAEDAPEIRRMLRKLGVEVVTANSNFTDPTTPGGETLAMMEAYRAKVDGEVKGHHVNRGKRDACRLGHWPGGPQNFGYRLKAILVYDQFSHSVLEPDPHTAWIIVEVYRLADERGWGCLRIVKALNADPRIPDGLKPFLADTIGEWLDNPIYYGTLNWGRNCTGPNNDRRVTRPIPEDKWEIIENFCPPLVERAVAERVRQLREARRQARQQSRKRD